MNKVIANWYSNLLALMHLIVVGALLFMVVASQFAPQSLSAPVRETMAGGSIFAFVGLLFAYVAIFGMFSVIVDIRRVANEQLELTKVMKERLLSEFKYPTDGVKPSEIVRITEGGDDPVAMWNDPEALKKYNDQH